MHNFFHPKGHRGRVVFNFIGRPAEELTAFAAGYCQAGHTVAARIAGLPHCPDYEGYPVLFLYRHALELYLKAIVYRGAKLLKLISDEKVDTEKLFGSHGLARLLPAVKAIFKEMQWNFDGSGLRSLNDFENFIRDLDKLDFRGDAFRYPITTGGNACLPMHFVVNVVEFSERMDLLMNFLEGAAELIRENWRAEAEARYELQQLSAEWQNS